MKKKRIIRIVFFVLALAIAIYAFTNGIMSLAHRESGYYDVDFTAEANATLYGSGLHLVYYAEGSSNAIRETLRNVQRVYTDSALRTYKLLSADQTYEDVVNIASVNASPGQWLDISQDLLLVLESAQSAGQGGGYSIYAGALHRAWRTLRYLDEPDAFDPANDPEKEELFRRLAAWIAAPGTFSLELDKHNNRARLDISDEYTAWALENEIDAPVLDLNVLHDGYMLSAVSALLKQAGYTSGYLYTDSGLSMYLDPNGKEIPFSLLTRDGEQARVNLKSPFSSVRFSAFAPEGQRYNFYTLTDGDSTLYRHPYPDIQSGLYTDLLMTCSVASAKQTPQALSLFMAQINALGDRYALDSYIARLPEDVFVFYTLQNDSEKTLYIRQSVPSAPLSLPEEGAWKIVSLNEP